MLEKVEGSKQNLIFINVLILELPLPSSWNYLYTSSIVQNYVEWVRLNDDLFTKLNEGIMRPNDDLTILRSAYRKHKMRVTDSCCAGKRILSDVCLVGKIIQSGKTSKDWSILQGYLTISFTR